MHIHNIYNIYPLKYQYLSLAYQQLYPYFSFHSNVAK